MLRTISLLLVSFAVAGSLLFSIHRFVQSELDIEVKDGVEVRYSQSRASYPEIQRELAGISQISWTTEGSSALIVEIIDGSAQDECKVFNCQRLGYWRAGVGASRIADFWRIDEIALSPDGDLGLLFARRTSDEESSKLYFWSPGDGIHLVREQSFPGRYSIEFIGGRDEVALVSDDRAGESYRMSFRRQAGENRMRETPASIAYDFKLKPLLLSVYRSSSNNREEFRIYPKGFDGQPLIDLNGDGGADILTFRASAGRALWQGFTLDGVSSTLPGTSNVIGSSAVWSLGDERGIPVPGDYNGDGLLDFATYSPYYSESDSDLRGNWQIYLSRSARMNGSRVSPNSSASFLSVRWGHTTYRAVPADYDGDGKTDIAVFDPESGTWHLLFAAAGFNHAKARLKSKSRAAESIQWGLVGDVPFALDMNGDSCADHVVMRQEEQLTWHVKYRTCSGKNSTKPSEVIQFGERGDFPVPADYNGDGATELAVYRRRQKRWLIRDSAENVRIVRWSSRGRPFAADFDADGRDDLAFYNSSGPAHYEILSSRVSSQLRRDLIHRGLGVQKIAWGSARDVPTALLDLDHRMGVANE
jgi:hypothetical protein